MLVFAVYLGKNNLINERLTKLCMKSWNRNLPTIIGDYEFKLFTEDSAEYKECFAQFDDIKVNHLALRYRADIFRVYILSKYSQALYLDLDTYITEYFVLPDFYFNSCWNIIYNGINTNFFKDLFQKYIDVQLSGMEDKEIFLKLQLAHEKYMDYCEPFGSIHLFWIKQDEIKTYFRSDFTCILTTSAMIESIEAEFARHNKFLLVDSFAPRVDTRHFSLYNDEYLIDYLKTIKTIIDRTV